MSTSSQVGFKLAHHCLFAFTAFVILALSYRFFVVDMVDYLPVSRVTIPDSEYYTVFANEEFAANGFAAFEGRKNYFFPTMLAYSVRNIAYGDLLLNSIFVGLIAVTLVRLLAAYRCTNPLPIYFTLLNPETIYYAQGFLKEIPSLFAFVLFLYALKRKRWSVLGFSIVLALTIRFQLGAILLALASLQFIPRRSRGFAVGTVVAGIVAAAPVIYQYAFAEDVAAAAVFRSESPGFGIGAMLEQGMLNVPFAGLFIAPLRAVQNLLEPWPHVAVFDATGAINVYDCVLAATAVIMVPFYVRFIFLAVQQVAHLCNASRFPETPQSISPVLFALLLATLNPFIHHRYVYFCSTLLCVTSCVEPSGWTLWQKQCSVVIMFIFCAAAMVSI